MRSARPRTDIVPPLDWMSARFGLIRRSGRPLALATISRRSSRIENPMMFCGQMSTNSWNWEAGQGLPAAAAPSLTHIIGWRPRVLVAVVGMWWSAAATDAHLTNSHFILANRPESNERLGLAIVADHTLERLALVGLCVGGGGAVYLLARSPPPIRSTPPPALPPSLPPHPPPTTPPASPSPRLSFALHLAPREGPRIYPYPWAPERRHARASRCTRVVWPGRAPSRAACPHGTSPWRGPAPANRGIA